MHAILWPSSSESQRLHKDVLYGTMRAHIQSFSWVLMPACSLKSLSLTATTRLSGPFSSSRCPRKPSQPPETPLSLWSLSRSLSLQRRSVVHEPTSNPSRLRPIHLPSSACLTSASRQGLVPSCLSQNPIHQLSSKQLYRFLHQTLSNQDAVTTIHSHLGSRCARVALAVLARVPLPVQWWVLHSLRNRHRQREGAPGALRAQQVARAAH